MPPAPIERTFSFRTPENVRCYGYDVAIDRRQPLGVALGRWVRPAERKNMSFVCEAS
jgi:hypothetical protein